MQTQVALDAAIHDPEKAILRKMLRATTAEYLYHLSGRPYVKVYPEALEDLIQIGMATEIRSLRIPYDAFAILLPENNVLRSDEPVDLNLVTRSVRLGAGVGEATAILVTILNAQRLAKIDGGDPHLLERIGFPSVGRLVVATRYGEDTYGMYDEDLAEYEKLDGLSFDDTEGGSRSTFRATCLAVGVAQVMTSHPDHVEREVINRLQGRYDATDDLAAKKKIEKKSKRNGKLGHRIVSLRGIRHRVGTPIKRNARGELEYQHTRRGHYRRVRYGKGRTKTRKVFIENLVVRPDKPLHPTDREYRIDDASTKLDASKLRKVT